MIFPFIFVCFLIYCILRGGKKRQEKWDDDEQRRSWATLQTTTPWAQSTLCAIACSSTRSTLHMHNTSKDMQHEFKQTEVRCGLCQRGWTSGCRLAHPFSECIFMKSINCTVGIFLHDLCKKKNYPSNSFGTTGWQDGNGPIRVSSAYVTTNIGLHYKILPNLLQLHLVFLHLVSSNKKYLELK